MTKRVLTQTFGVVGAILERDGKILLVKEAKEIAKGMWSHPAGWIDVGENLIEAVKREVKEEAGLGFEPTHILGVYSLFLKNLKERCSKVMFYTGIVLIIVAAILLLGNFMGESTFPTILGAMGVIFIGASKFRLLK